MTARSTQRERENIWRGPVQEREWINDPCHDVRRYFSVEMELLDILVGVTHFNVLFTVLSRSENPS